MGFSEAQFTATINRINSGMEDLGHKIGEVPRAANEAVDRWYLPGFVNPSR
ncbi:hypothetical protein LX15_000791 [Streptoalloteichus tenebrarius]|uniref:Uncharacterized protein n=1 Tax=Streptoalloteichus tenebrarius (strain ATCC 17920 / DSM 40477 / JCM 4838 / CBS 697.72 / NBRC 16177 / NCIMB 11028 / NRRL B-12390 / A12253. 1 / ISP 5477) TaxID=1933 RepID=A0ABT1HNL9_STRSD|nr:hypothetical protein [Streptoalloteichus tenebrarius]MCP2257106.1 hypothetical protein [Streptoalloteichus tenebrarius]BFE98737.1 hypothetical protein GCM10020241_04130 [Streptoalloteichus tenebrarius]